MAFFSLPIWSWHLWRNMADYSPRRVLAASLYLLGMVACYGFSGQYHRRRWSAEAGPWVRRLDHCGILLMTAGSYTPSALLLSRGWVCVSLIWSSCIVACIQNLFFPKYKSKLHTLVKILVPAVLLPYVAVWWRDWWTPLHRAMCLLTYTCYLTGVGVYLGRRPNPAPGIFGYHEVFHVLVLIAGVCTYVVNLSLLSAF